MDVSPVNRCARWQILTVVLIIPTA